MRQFFVKHMKEWNVCCCSYHVEIDEMQGALNNMCTKFGIHFNWCECFCEEICQYANEESFECVGALTTYPTLTSFWEPMVCMCDEYSKWHSSRTNY